MLRKATPQNQTSLRCCPAAILVFSPLLALASVLSPGSAPAQTPVTPAVTPPVETHSAPLCPAQLGQAMDAIANRTEFQRGRWGILVETLAPPTRLYARDPDHYFVPASNAKLFTTVAALRQLGPELRLKTTAYALGTAPTVQQLWVSGQGDPGLTQVQLNQLAQQLYQQGIRRVNQLQVSDRYFTGEWINPTWEWEDLASGDGVPVNSLILDQNTIELKLSPQKLGQPLRLEFTDAQEARRWRVINSTKTVAADAPEFIQIQRDYTQPLLTITGQLRVGADPETAYTGVLDPDQHFLRKLGQALTDQGIQVSSMQVVQTSQPSAAQQVTEITSPPLAELVQTTNLESNNLYAEVLLRTLGQHQLRQNQSNQTDSSRIRGLKTLETVLSDLGVDSQSYSLVDGSGLSRRNQVTPTALVQLLRGISQTSEADLFQASLPVAGVSGTLKGRLRGTPAAAQLRAKTGTLTDVSALSGYLNPPNFQPLVFSILVNQTGQPTAVLRKAIDEMVLLLSQLRSC